MWTVNATWGVSTGTGEGQTWLPWLPAVGGVMGLLALVTVVLNVTLLLSVLLHAPSRSRSFQMHIVNMSVVAVLQGAGVLPLWTHYLIQGSWIHGDAVCRWWLATDTMATSAFALSLVVTACDRFIYLLCWRFVKEGGKYVLCCVLMAVAWLLALTLTLTLTMVELEGSGWHDDDRWNGPQRDDACYWGRGKGGPVVAARLVMYAVGAGLGAGLSLALATLSCLGLGHQLPLDDTELEAEERGRRRSLLQEYRGPRHAHGHGHAHGRRDSNKQHNSEVFDEDFPEIYLVKSTDRLEERERWKGQVVSLLTVSLAWAVLWLPSHLLVFAQVLRLEWHVPQGFVIVAGILGYVHAAILPLLWLLHQPIRLALARLIFCRCCRGQGEGDPLDDSMEFQDVGPYRPPEVAS